MEVEVGVEKRKVGAGADTGKEMIAEKTRKEREEVDQDQENVLKDLEVEAGEDLTATAVTAVEVEVDHWITGKL